MPLGVLAASWRSSLCAFARTVASTSHRYATSVLGERAKLRASTIPRPLSPMTATTTFSLADRPNDIAGDEMRLPNMSPNPASDVSRTNSRRSMIGFRFIGRPSSLARNGLQLADPDPAKVHLVAVVL